MWKLERHNILLFSLLIPSGPYFSYKVSIAFHFFSREGGALWIGILITWLHCCGEARRKQNKSSYTHKIVMKNTSRVQPFKFSVLRNTIVQHLQDSKSLYNIKYCQNIQKNFKHQIVSQVYPFMSTFRHSGVQSILKPPWNKTKPSIFLDEAKCDPLHMLYYMNFFHMIGFQHQSAPYILYTILQNFTSNKC